MEPHTIESAIALHQFDLLVVPFLRHTRGAGVARQPRPAAAGLEKESVAVRAD